MLREKCKAKFRSLYYYNRQSIRVILQLCLVFGNIQHGFAVNLRGAGAREFYADFIAGKDLDHIGFRNMLALENRGESNQRLEL